MNDSPMSLPPTPETKLRDGYKGTTGQPAFAIYERSKTNRNRGCARYTGFHYHISSYSKHGLLRGRPSLLRFGLCGKGRPRRATSTLLYCARYKFLVTTLLVKTIVSQMIRFLPI